MKKLTALLCSSSFFFIIMCLYFFLDQFSSNTYNDGFQEETNNVQQSIHDLQKKVYELGDILDFSSRAIETMNKKIDNIHGDNNKVNTGNRSYIKFSPKKVIYSHNKEEDHSMCLFTSVFNSTIDIKMADVYDEVPFDNINGGVWKQGWEVEYRKDAFDKQKLLVFVMPHSHNDPGWLKTVDEYFHDQTVKIISNVVDALAKNVNRKFIWAETSYAALWWDQASPAKKQLFQELIHNGQLEIVTGGWVMNDEANTHYFNIIDQMVEGHQWMEKHVGIKPKNSWSIDPFGYSPTMAYILKRMGFECMLIQRVHYRIKKYLAENKNLEFMWRQNWDHGSTTDIFTHVMPFYSYDVPHTCGPDPKICCQFDFKRLPGGGVYCPWHIPPREVQDDNIKERSETLLDQYKKKAQLYRSNVVLAPLGDDFRYDKVFEVLAQYTNYEKIMEYVNSHPELNAEIRFGTLKDYFQAVAEREGVKPGEKPQSFKTLGGDFFTYADRDDHYWSGYFTSRSFFKHMDRELTGHLRAAEIIYSLAKSYHKNAQQFPEDNMYSELMHARKSLALFQHHDGVTGTSKNPVVNDFGQKMFDAIKSSIKVMESSANFLLTHKNFQYSDSIGNTQIFLFGENRMSFDSLPIKNLIIISDKPSQVVFYNSLAQERKQTVFLHVSEPLVEVKSSTGEAIPYQVSLLWKDSLSAHNAKYEVSFVAVIPALGLSKYFISRAVTSNTSYLSVTTTYNINQPTINEKFKVSAGNTKEIYVKNDYLKAVFDADTGLLTDLSTDGIVLKKVQIIFMSYGTVANMDRSGAYLFLPSGEATSIVENNPPITITSGPIYTEVMTRLQFVVHKVRIYHSDTLEAQSLDIRNVLDIRQTNNFEFVMRIESGIQNNDREFFTDLNGFQMQRRKTLAKLPLQANFYPAPSMIFIQDKKSRITLQTQQANGVASLEQGFIEVVLDRKLNQDDNRGLGQGVMDNRVTLSAFRLILENFENPPPEKTSLIAYPSMLSMSLSHQLQNPIYDFVVAASVPINQFNSGFSGLKVPLPCDLHLLNLKMLQDNNRVAPSDTAALFLHRVGFDCAFKKVCLTNEVTYAEIFNPLNIVHLEETSLSLMHSHKFLNNKNKIDISPMEIQAYKIKLT
ncbi:alpha-mannosidase 2 isoform X2 [Hydra vulgaris]|uniref:Alpha-mannosidase n=1 Tax=Hydra vulgaris TaxID=6087 RepID=A0ABM4BIN0_HYDVU